MRNKLLFLISTSAFLLISTFALGQAPQAFKYQAVARNAAGAELSLTSIVIRISIHDISPAGTIVYSEEHAVTTDQFGLFSINIGQGTPTSGTFSGIAWGSGAKFIEQEIDIGTGFLNMGTTQLLSVPYALYAESSGASAAIGP